MTTKEEWIAYRYGAIDINPPFDGWVNERLQNEQHKKLQAIYIKAADARLAKITAKDSDALVLQGL